MSRTPAPDAERTPFACCVSGWLSSRVPSITPLHLKLAPYLSWLRCPPRVGCKLGQLPGAGAGGSRGPGIQRVLPQRMFASEPWPYPVDKSLLRRSQATWELQLQGPPEGTPLASRSRVKIWPPCLCDALPPQGPPLQATPPRCTRLSSVRHHLRLAVSWGAAPCPPTWHQTSNV